jgi:small-conductance mechanosensitive channel
VRLGIDRQISKLRPKAALFNIAVAMILLGLFALDGANTALAQERSDENDTAIAVGDQSISDAAIKDRLSAIFAEIDGTDGIVVMVDSGVITLSGVVADPALEQQAVRLANRVQGAVTLRNKLEVADDVGQRLTPAVERLKTRVYNTIAMLPLLGVGLIVFLVVVTVGVVIARMDRLWAKLTPNAFVADLVKQLVTVAFIAAGLVLTLDLIGATTLLGTLLGAAGIIGLAVGFAVRDTIENYIASIMLSVRQPFRPNEHIKIGDHEGRVVRLSSRATILMTLEGNHVRVPNAMVFKAEIINYTRNPQRRFEFRLGVNADADLKAALATGLTVLSDIPEILRDPEPDGWIDSVGDSNVILWFGAWVDQDVQHFARTRSKAIRLVKEALEAGGFELPEPIYRVRLTEIPETGGLALGHNKSATPSTPSPSPDPQPDQKSAPEVVTPTVDPEAAQQDNAIIEAVEADRAAGGEDLLKKYAPEE